MSENRRKPDQFLLRLPPGLKERIRARAEKEGRSTNEEIVRVIEESLDGTFPDPADPAVQEVMIQRMREVMNTVVDDMREEQRLANGLPLLLKWWEENPHERAEFEAMSEKDQQEYVREQSHSLWVEHLNQKRLARPLVGRK